MYSWRIARDTAGKCTGLEVEDSVHSFESWISDLLTRAMRLRRVLEKGGSIEDGIRELVTLRAQQQMRKEGYNQNN
jgi:hypothetical protein